MLGIKWNQPFKFRVTIWVEIIDDSRGTYNINRQINYKATMIKFSLRDYSYAYILVKGTISVSNIAAPDANANNVNKKVIFKNCALFINCISEIDKTKVDNAKDIDIAMPMYDLTEYSDIYSKTSGSWWQYCKDILVINNNGDTVEFNRTNATDSFKFKEKNDWSNWG